MPPKTTDDRDQGAVLITFADGPTERVLSRDYTRAYAIPVLHEQVVQDRLRA